MAYDERLVERIRQILAGRSDVVEKRMVGGRSFMVGVHPCCGVTGPDLMVRVGPAAYQPALAKPHTRPMQFARRPVIGYVLVAPEGSGPRQRSRRGCSGASTSCRLFRRRGASSAASVRSDRASVAWRLGPSGCGLPLAMPRPADQLR